MSTPTPAVPTLEEVARRAGVSRATVSRVINDSPKVSPAAREAVLEAVAELRYVPNQVARSLVRRRTDTLALVLSEPDTRLFSDPSFASIVRGVSATLADTERNLVLLTARDRREQEKVGRYVMQGHVDGVLFMSLRDELVEAGDFTEGGGCRAAEAPLARRPDLDALFAASDPMAVGALAALRAAGRRVPDDVAVVGFDDAEVARTCDPPLTTVAQPLPEMARLLVELLVRRVEGTADAHEHHVVPTTLVRRTSA